jgi:hypothetical protein
VPRRFYSSTAFAGTLTADINNVVTSFAVSTVTGHPSTYPYTIIVNENTANEEVMEVTNRSGTTLTVTRGVDGTTAVSHLSGASVKHGVSARDFDEPNAFLNEGGTIVETSTARFQLTNTAGAAALSVEGTSNSTADVTRYSSTSGPALFLSRSTSNTLGTQAAIADGNTLGSVEFRGSDGTVLASGAMVTAAGEGAWTGSSRPARLRFSTVPANGTGLTERMRIDSTGRVQIFGTAGGANPLVDDPRLVVIGSSGNTTANVTANVTAGSNVLDVTAVTSGTLAVGQHVQTILPEGNIPPGTYIESLGTGSGGTGTYNLSAVSQGTFAGINVQTRAATELPVVRLRNIDTATTVGEPVGGIEFYGSDISTNSDHVRASIYAISDDSSGQTSMSFSTSAFQGSPQVRMRLDGNGLLSGRGTSLGPWIAYTPSVIGTGWAIGNGTITGSYSQIGKMVHFRVAITWGSTSTYGTAQLGIGTTPHGGTLASTPTANSNIIDVVGYDTSAATYYQLAGRWGTTVNFNLFTIGTGGVMANVTNTAPFTWASGDFIWLAGCYEAA